MNPLNVSEEEFRRLAARVSSMAGDYYARLPDVRAYPRTSGAQTREALDEPLPLEGLHGRALDALGKVMAMSRAPSPRFFGYVLGSGEPVAALADLLASVLNQNVTAWRSAPAAITIERQVVRWIAQALGCEGMSGSLCGGGSSANLMALAMAREARLPANERGAQPGMVYASSEAHMSLAKAVALLGLGRRNLRLVPVDEHFRMSAAALEAAIAEDRAAGRAPIAVVASAGTVSTGAIDPLEQIGAICRAQGLWLHVDGAYGVPAALVAAEKFRGLSAADSMSLDLHKWLYQPMDCGMLLFKDPSHARATFSHTGEYARVLDADPVEGFAFFEESLELSRRFRALKIWLSLRYHGLNAFRAAIRADLEHARQLVESIRGTPQLELLAPVELSAVCFRYRECSAGADLDELNSAILRRVIDNGRVYLSNASVHGHFALRACFVNHRTQPADVAQIVPEVLEAAREIVAGGR
ncbi:MAG: Aromatic-L-amino-acid decarboxylase [Gammaproteobacteria bacterium]|jgi:aromatic-L-amino-acid decarboxylase|nr:Aromatic-L-amino-acid decarboxylase [Gammaproteobacteria bacterium]